MAPLSMPSRPTPRRMNGTTEAGKSMPWARPHAATAPPSGLRAGVRQRVAADGVDHAGPALLLHRLAGRGELGAIETVVAPSPFR